MTILHKNDHNFLNNWPIFNLKLKSEIEKLRISAIQQYF